MRTFDEFINESYSKLNEKRLSNFHPFLDGSDIWPEDIKQFFVNGSTAYILYKGTDDESDKKSADIVLTKIKTMFGRLRQRTYRDKQPGGGYHVEVTYTKKDKIPERYHVAHVENFDAKKYKAITESELTINEGKVAEAIMDAIDYWYDGDSSDKAKALKDLFKYVDLDKKKVEAILKKETDAMDAMEKIMDLAESVDEANTDSYAPPKYLISPALDPEGKGIPVDKMHKYMEAELEKRSSYFKPGIRSANPPEEGREVEHTLNDDDE